MLKNNAFDLTNPQKNIWVTEQYYNNTNINNICGSAYIKQELDFNKLKEAINIVIKNNDSYNIKFFIENNVLKQYVDEYKYYNVEIVDVANERELHRLEKEICEKIFNVENEDLFEFKIFRFPNNHGGYIMNIHHLLSDSWSHGLACKEVIRIYNNLINNVTEEDKKYSYLDYISKEKEYLVSDAFKKDKEYWDNMYNTVPEVATIPSIKEKANSNTNSLGKRKSIKISEELTKKINDFCRENKISIYNFFMSIYSMYISRVSNLEDFVIGTPILNRTNFVDKHTTGMFISTVPLRISIKDGSTFLDFAKDIGTRSMSMLRHQRYPYQNILEEIRKKDSNVPNLYNIVLSYQITKIVNEGIDYTTNWVFNGNCADDMQIHILDLNESGSLDISYDFKAQKYTTHEIVDMHNRILCMIEQVIENQQILVDDIEIVTEEEKNKILYEFNDTKVDYPRDKTIIDLFEEQVEKTPDNIAIVFEDKKLTYRELNEKANSLANYLRKIGIKPNMAVGIMLNRSLELIISLLGVLKAGGAYLPIDPTYPDSRIEYILENSCVNTILTLKNIKDKIKNTKNVICTDLSDSKIYITEENKNLSNVNKSEDTAYIIYTSGSTGKPKGVVISHKNVNNFIKATCDKIKFKGNIVSVTTFCFDIFVLESLLPLQKGISIVMANEQEQNISELLNEICIKNNVKMIQTTPARMQLLLNDEKLDYFKNLETIMLGGEPFPKILLKKLKRITNAKIYNMYGPTETTVWSTIKDLSENDNITIGEPIGNTQIYILNKHNKICPIGVEGEIFISGDGVGKGYFNRDDLTIDRFIENPFIKGTKIYKSGDIGKFNLDGEIICLGRIDHQVKIRGLRIELDEIQEIILEDENIKNCIVAKETLKDGNDVLCAYIVENIEVDIKETRKRIKEKLPLYMVPQYFVKLQDMPYTPNGKIDRKLLKLPEDNIENSEKEIILARNKTDKALIKLIEKRLKIQQVTISNSFLELGGDSLEAINLSLEIYNKFKVQISVKDILNCESIIELSNRIDKHSDENSFHISKIEQQDKYPLSSAQKRIYYASKMAGEETLLYNVPGAILINKKLDKAKVEKVFNEIIKRHSSLRTKFIVDDGEVYQKITEKAQIKINTLNSTEKEIKKIVNEFPKPFNLEKDLLLRIELHYIDNEKTLLLLDSHHIITDGTSLNILVDEFIKLYNGEQLDNIQIEYKDYAIWENNFINSEEIKPLEKYWLDKFKDTEFNSLNLPYDYSVPANRNYNGKRISKTLDKIKFNELEQYAKKIGVSPYMLFLSAFYILLYKYTGQTDITLGSPSANREIYETKNLIGMFVNNIVTKAQIDSNKKFTDFVQEIKEQVLNDLENEAYPYDLLVKKLNIPVDNSKNPLFDVMFIYQNTENDNIIFDGEEVKQIVADSNIAKFNLSFEIEPSKNNINLEYATSLFKKETIERLYEHYMNVLEYILNNNETLIKDIDILSEAEKNKILYEFNAQRLQTDNEKLNLNKIFKETVKKRENKIAITCGGEILTYKDLDEKSNSLANFLLEQGITKGDVVGICLNRSLELIISMWAALKIGAIYMPMYIDYPDDRLSYMLEDSNAKILITNSNKKEKINFKGIKKIIDSSNEIEKQEEINKTINIDNNEIAYIIYTSGSTGRPKGVQITHKNLVNFIDNFKEYYNGIDEKDIFLSTTNISFDVSIWEIFLPLLNGAKLVLYKEDIIKDIIDYCNTIREYGVTSLYIPPNILNEVHDILKQDGYTKITKLLVGVEPIRKSTLNKYIETNTNIKIVNGYGPTETTICCTALEYNFDKEEGIVSIGKPLKNDNIYILDKDRKLQPIGIVGEIYVTGLGVGAGYINNEQETQKNYINNLYDTDSNIMYKTGDLAKWNQDGTIHFIGRNDSQVKISGHRIELSEITKTIMEFPNIEKAFTMLSKKGSKEYICSYYVADKEIINSDLITFLKSKLADYMIPDILLQMKKFPLTPNGKIDKNKLPVDIKLKTKYIEPRNEFEKNIAQIWKNLFMLDKVGIDDSFFELGGDSLIAIKFQTEALNLGINISYSDIFAYPTIRKLSGKKNNVNLYEIDKDYDYSEIDKIISKNSTEFLEEYKMNSKSKIGNILLIGSTGFLGAHILNEYLKQHKGIAYCLVRKKSGVEPEERLRKTLNFYFGDKYDKYFGDRIIVVPGDITEERFGLSLPECENLSDKINNIIHSAALVKHYGDFKIFNDINVVGTQNVADFAHKYNKKLYYISTLSISGTGSKEKRYFEEKDFYFGQDIDNVYLYTKFEAEKVIYEKIKDGLSACILRIGNITNRYSDGKFQINVSENAFINRIKAFINLGVIQEKFLEHSIEFTPVDLCAEAIVKIASSNPTFNTFHLFNNNIINVGKLLEILSELDVKLLPVKDKEFSNIIKRYLKDEQLKSQISGIIADLENNKLLNLIMTTIPSDIFTNKYLNELNFKWSDINKEYLKKYINYFRNIKYI